MCDHAKFVRDTSPITPDGHRVDRCGGCGEVLAMHCPSTQRPEQFEALGATVACEGCDGPLF